MMIPLHFFKKMSVREKILFLFLALSLISLGIMGSVALFTLNNIGNYAERSSSSLGTVAVNDSSSALQLAAETHMVRVVSDQAEISNVLFEDTEAEIDILAAQAGTLQDNPGIIPAMRSYTRENPPSTPLDGTVVISAPGVPVDPHSDEYRSLAGMSDLLRAVFQIDDDLTGIYITTDSGIMVTYPWNGNTTRDYDPRTRGWFTAAKASNHPVWSELYVDAAGHGLIVTCSRAVPTRYGTWVIASDLTIETLNQEILNLTLAGDGYAVLLDSHGNVIIRPGLSAGGTRWNQPFSTENVFSSSNPALVALGRNMTAGKTGIDSVVFDGEEMYVAYAPVRSLNWSFAVSMPAAEIVAPAKITGSRINEAANASRALIFEQTDRIQDIFGGLFFLILLIVVLLAVQLARVITRPVESLKHAAAALGEGNLEYRVTLATGDEFEELANSFNQMALDLKSNIENLKRTTAEKERYTKEMEIAQEIQMSFLPESTPVIPGVEIAAVNIPAMEIGGDLYDFIPVDPSKWGFVIADVSGKGVSAALFMALSRTLIRASGECEPDPGIVVQNANRMIYENAKSSMFVTTFYAVLDAKKMCFSYVNAGHNPPVIFRGESAEARYLDGRDIALGIVPEVNIAPKVLSLEDGDILVMYTDGVTEAFNTGDEWFGEERLVDFVRRNRTLSAKDILSGLVAEVRSFAGSAPQSDDLTLVILRVH